ncbi:hypothetical protein [Domibacillus tundrae]|uniref:hypothetical protein n=1 Tax=Domibacillus tundrae TaxID=1587527 RepID=UPI000617E8E1|nr:hypothetical protein [Domibacillus tundrae]
MTNKEVKSEVPPNFKELKKSADRKSNWRGRLDAVEELGQSKSEPTIKLLKRIMAIDTVTKVQDAAYRELKKWGEDVQSPKKKGEAIKDVSKILLRIKKSLPKDHTFDEFEEKLKKMRLDVYDTYEGEKGAEFDHWLKETWESLLTK